MDMTIVLDLHQFGLQATIEHQGPFMYTGLYTSLSTVAKTFYCNEGKITYFEITDTKSCYTSHAVMYKVIT